MAASPVREGEETLRRRALTLFGVKSAVVGRGEWERGALQTKEHERPLRECLNCYLVAQMRNEEQQKTRVQRMDTKQVKKGRRWIQKWIEGKERDFGGEAA